MPLSKKEIESELGFEVPDVPVTVGATRPIDNEESGEKFELIGYIWGKFEIFRKTKFGKLVEIYCYAIALGFTSLPTPFEIGNYVLSQTSEYASVLYRQIENGYQEPPKYFAVLPPLGFEEKINIEQIQREQIPIGTGIYPISGSLA